MEKEEDFTEEYFDYACGSGRYMIGYQYCTNNGIFDNLQNSTGGGTVAGNINPPYMNISGEGHPRISLHPDSNIT